MLTPHYIADFVGIDYKTARLKLSTLSKIEGIEKGRDRSGYTFYRIRPDSELSHVLQSLFVIADKKRRINIGGKTYWLFKTGSSKDNLDHYLELDPVIRLLVRFGSLRDEFLGKHVKYDYKVLVREVADDIFGAYLYVKRRKVVSV